MIRVVNHYEDDETHVRVTSYERYVERSGEFLDVKRPKDIRFEGHAVVGISLPQGTLERPISFPIEAESVSEAFEKFEEAKEKEGPVEAKKIIDEMKAQFEAQQEQQRSKILVPGQMPPQMGR